ncbi:hypothetical protein C8F04DRAFT_592419 [Mycena alexandri]|uniref:Secreted protein n=1 Tax=Mycena alexandri TaxID=1745969 RepID=A0AAD6TDM3_9AGAR|nr:hypothetical protein C8F04DRAFT_592419 [Mycena alexandri]
MRKTCFGALTVLSSSVICLLKDLSWNVRRNGSKGPEIHPSRSDFLLCRVRHATNDKKPTTPQQGGAFPWNLCFEISSIHERRFAISALQLHSVPRYTHPHHRVRSTTFDGESVFCAYPQHVR